VPPLLDPLTGMPITTDPHYNFPTERTPPTQEPPPRPKPVITPVDPKLKPTIEKILQGKLKPIKGQAGYFKCKDSRSGQPLPVPGTTVWKGPGHRVEWNPILLLPPDKLRAKLKELK
jgi:hypothetical protein